jgi:hypothetical protein
MRADGATVVEIEGSYEAAVRRAAEVGAETGATIVSDTAWPGYEEIPRWIMAGYTQVFEEAYNQWDRPPGSCSSRGALAASSARRQLGRVAVRRQPPADHRLRTGRRRVPARISQPPARRSPCTARTRHRHGRPAMRRGLARRLAIYPRRRGRVHLGARRYRAGDPGAPGASRYGDDPIILAGPSGACSTAALLARPRARAETPARRARDRQVHGGVGDRGNLVQGTYRHAAPLGLVLRRSLRWSKIRIRRSARQRQFGFDHLRIFPQRSGRRRHRRGRDPYGGSTRMR